MTFEREEALNQRQFQELAEERLTDAKTLLDAGRYRAAYYLLGYAVECALKACISKQTKEHDFPKKSSSQIYTHKIKELVTYAKLGPGFESTAVRSSIF